MKTGKNVFPFYIFTIPGEAVFIIFFIPVFFPPRVNFRWSELDGMTNGYYL